MRGYHYFLFTVFGWIDGERFTQPERPATYELPVGFIKGRQVQEFFTGQSFAAFRIVVIEDGGAGK